MLRLQPLTPFEFGDWLSIDPRWQPAMDEADAVVYSELLRFSGPVEADSCGVLLQDGSIQVFASVTAGGAPIASVLLHRIPRGDWDVGEFS